MKRLSLLLALALSGTPTLAQDIPSGTIMFNSDAPCSIKVDGEAVGEVANTQEILKVSVPAGKHLVIANHRVYPTALFRAVVEVGAGETEIVLIELVDLPQADPSWRFRDQGNGTVKDMKTGLIWLRDVGCLGVLPLAEAEIRVNNLSSGQCGLSDDSKPGDWHLPHTSAFNTIMALNCPTPPALLGSGPGKPGCFTTAPWLKGRFSKDYWTNQPGAGCRTVAGYSRGIGPGCEHCRANDVALLTPDPERRSPYSDPEGTPFWGYTCRAESSGVWAVNYSSQYEGWDR